MPYFICNQIPNNNGEHEVHIQNCIFLPAIQNRVFVGEFPNVYIAINHLKQIHAKQYYTFRGCPFCCYLSNDE